MDRLRNGETEVLTDIDRINIAYGRLNLDDYLAMYALSYHLDTTLSTSIESSLDRFGQAVAALACTNDRINIDLVRSAFGRLYEGMEKAHDAKYGPDIVKSDTLSQFILTKLGLLKPIYRKHFRPLDNHYWDTQFMQEYSEQTWVERIPEETEQEYAGRYIGTCLRRFPWPIFSYI